MPPLTNMSGPKVLNFFIIITLYSFVHSLTDEEVVAEFTKTLIKCTQEHPVELKELLQLRELKVPKNYETKCLLACTYKKTKSFNQKGMYDLEQGYRMAELNKNGDEKRLVNGRKIAELCNKVNEVKVRDGEKGCERAAFLFKCFTENAPKLGFKVM